MNEDRIDAQGVRHRPSSRHYLDYRNTNHRGYEMTMPKCTSVWGHKYEARFSYQNPAIAKFFERATRIDRLTGEFVEDCRDATYERDICIRCGHVVEKAK